jgi:hypothetical protein
MPDQRVPGPTLCETNSTHLTFSVLGISRSYFKFYCFDIFKLFTFQGVLNSGKEENGTWDHVWGVWVLTHLWDVFSGYNCCTTWVKCASAPSSSSSNVPDYHFLGCSQLNESP